MDCFDFLELFYVQNSDTITLRIIIVGEGGNFRISGFLPGISIYYNPPYLRFLKKISSVPKFFFETLPILLNSCSFWPKFEFFLGIFQRPPFIITPPLCRFQKFADPPWQIDPPPTIMIGRVKEGGMQGQNYKLSPF